jgi:uncharacterized protein YsxB (DUF464 family)
MGYFMAAFLFSIDRVCVAARWITRVSSRAPVARVDEGGRFRGVFSSASVRCHARVTKPSRECWHGICRCGLANQGSGFVGCAAVALVVQSLLLELDELLSLDEQLELSLLLLELL